MTVYEGIFAKISQMNPTHLETLAVAVLSTLDGLPMRAFQEIADLAQEHGAEWLAEFHADMVS